MKTKGGFRLGFPVRSSPLIVLVVDAFGSRSLSMRQIVNMPGHSFFASDRPRSDC